MVTPSKISAADEEAYLKEHHFTVGRRVLFDNGRTSRSGKITKIRRSKEETPHPPKIEYVCVKENGEEKTYTNNPSKLIRDSTKHH